MTKIRPVCALLIASLLSLQGTGCAFRYNIGPEAVTAMEFGGGVGSPVERARAACAVRIRSLRSNFNSYGSATEAFLYINVAAAIATTVLAGVAAAQTASGADTIDEATRLQGEISGTEIAAIVVGGTTALTTGTTAVFAQQQGELNGEINAVMVLLTRLQTDADVLANMGELASLCFYEPDIAPADDVAVSESGTAGGEVADASDEDRTATSPGSS